MIRTPFRSSTITDVLKKPHRGVLIALIGCDGAGKSTLAADLTRWIDTVRPAEQVYLGLGTGDLGRKIQALPLIGSILGRVLIGKAKTTRTKGEKIPGPVTALVVYGFSRLRYRRFCKMRAALANGISIITDRYPQTDVAGFFDGPGLSAARAEGRIVKFLARREAALYREMADFLPDMVVRLEIDAETAFSRKPDHDLEALKQKVDALSHIHFGGARSIEIDACAPYEQVLATIQSACQALVG